MEVEEGAFFGFLRALAQEKRPVVVPHAASSHAPLSGSMSGCQHSLLTNIIAICYIYYSTLL